MRAALVALLAGLLVYAIHAPSGEVAGTVVRSKIAGQDVRLDMPTGDGDPRGLAIWFHGQGGNVNDRIDGPFLSALRREGWAIAASDFHQQSWGNPASTDDAARLVAWAEKQAGIPVTLWVSGSMGGSTSLNALVHGVQPPACWYGVKPAISLTKMQDVPAGPRFIAAAYGGPVPSDRDPVRNVDALPDDVRYRVVASPMDQWVGFGDNGGLLYAGLKTRGVDVTMRLATGMHQDPSHWDATDLVDFADSCVGTSSGTTRAGAR